MSITLRSSTSSNSDQTLDAIRLVLMQNNFRVISTGGKSFEAIGPGMNSTHENPLLGATKIYVSMDSGSPTLTAELGGVRFMKGFLFIFPPALGLILGTMSGLANQSWSSFFMAFLPIAPWAILSPLMAYWIRNRTQTALQNLLDNAAENSQFLMLHH